MGLLPIRFNKQSNQNLIAQIKLRAPALKLASDGHLIKLANEYRDNINEQTSLDDFLIDTFALVREVARRTLGIEHRDNQLLGAIELYRGKIIELGNGEGKTLLSTMPIYLHAISGKGVHVATYNEYLAQRDALWMGQIYEFLGLSVGVLLTDNRASKLRRENDELKLVPCQRKDAYSADIVYGVYYEFVFDYLRDHMNIKSIEEKVQRGFNYILLDEADSALIDLGQTPCRIVAMAKESLENIVIQTFECATQLVESEDYIIDDANISLTEYGLYKAEKILNLDNIFSEKFAGYVYQLEQCLVALHIYKNERDYFIRNNFIYFIDRETGRAKRDTIRVDLALALKLKEKLLPKGVPLRDRGYESINEISYQHFFKRYPKMAGMSATAVWRAKEIRDVYDVDVVEIPSFRPTIREDLDDRVFRSREAAEQDAVREVIRIYSNGIGRPILVDAIEVDRAKKFSRLLNINHVPHNILTADNDENEANIIANAGQVGAVTVTAKMAGRGTDIKLSEDAEKLGGLHVIGLERMGQRHRDMQLQGRAGRQGKAGSSQFFVSLTDNLYQRFNGERVARFMIWAEIPDDQPIENSMITMSSRRAQWRLENHDSKLRQRVYEYDAVLQKQRQYIFDVRNRILVDNNLVEDIHLMIDNLSKRYVKTYLDDKARIKNNAKFKSFCERICQICPLISEELLVHEALETPDYIIQFTVGLLKEALNKIHFDTLGEQYFQITARYFLLSALDQEWREYLNVLEQLRSIASLRDNPLEWYIAESNTNFIKRLEAIEDRFLSYLFSVQLEKIINVSWDG